MKESVCYIGTHDNAPVNGWFKDLPEGERDKAERYLGINGNEGITRAFIRAGMGSVSDLFIMQMQDLLELGNEARMNTPGKPFGNWCWRMLPGKLTPELAAKLKDMTVLYGRA